MLRIENPSESLRDALLIVIFIIVGCLIFGSCAHGKQLLTIKETEGVAKDRQTETAFNVLARVLIGDSSLVNAIFIQRGENSGTFNFTVEAFEFVNSNTTTTYTVYGEINDKGEVVRYIDSAETHEGD